MNRQQLEHVIRAGAAIVGDSHLVVIGSQAILGQYPAAPAELLVSMEADFYPKHAPENAIVKGFGRRSPSPAAPEATKSRDPRSGLTHQFLSS